MNKLHSTHRASSCLSLKNTQGFTLIELMVSMLIGLIILNGVIQVVLNSKRSYLDNQEVSQIQENARFAIDTLSRELRMAGYFGCAPAGTGNFNVNPVSTANGLLVTDITGRPELLAVTGYESDAQAPDNFQAARRAGTDAIILRRTNPLGEGITTTAAVNSGGTLTVVGSDLDIKAGQPVVLASPDCSRGIAFNAGAVGGDAAQATIAGLPALGSFGGSLGEFKAGSTIAELVSEAYYISDSKVVSGVPALMREVLFLDGTAVKTRSEELALGIADMQLLYLERNSNGAVVYQEAAQVARWENVIAVQINLLMQSLNPVHAEPQTYTSLTKDANGDDLQASSRFLHQIASATVRVRNQ